MSVATARKHVGWIATSTSDVEEAQHTLTHPDLPSEQKYMGRLYDRLEELKSTARRRLDEAHSAGGGTPQARSERESYIRLYNQELATYRAANMGLCFGRLDGSDGSTNYVGRVGLREDDAELTPLLLDWRSDLSRPFYLATAARPEGIERRRHIRSHGRKVVDINDEYLDAELAARSGAKELDAADVAGEGALLEALDRARTGHMTDVVATIQREQDEIIRNQHRGVIVVQGGPGTGKTAVALHRAAYLLYTFREKLDRSGVLILGPNSTFLDYIERVLPSLGESGVVLRTIGNLYPGIEAVDTEPEHAEEVKGSEDMVEILKRAVKDRQSSPSEKTTISVDGVSLDVTPAMVRKARGRARMSRKPHNRARPAFVDVLLDQLTDVYADVVGRPLHVTAGDAESAAREAALFSDPDFDAVDDSGLVDVVADGGQVARIDEGGPEALERNLLTADDLANVRAELEDHDEVAALIDQWWPILAPEDVLADLLSSREAISSSASDYVEEDQEALFRTDGHAFTPADVPLIDELAEILGVDSEAEREEEERAWQEQLRQAEEALEILQGSANMEFEDTDSEILAAYDIVDAEALARRNRADSDLTVAERAAADRTWAFGHVIVDEAQELSPMAWRMVMRRSPNRWMTLVGDIAQTSNPAGVDAWGQALSPYVEDRWQLCELTVNYRTPATITAVADNLLRSISDTISSPRPVREGRYPVGWHDAPLDDSGAIESTLMSILSTLEEGRSTAIVATAERCAKLARLPELQSVLSASTEDAGLLQVEDVRRVKGLEFDHVVVVGPGEITGGSIQGMQDLYVALTRATQQLHIVFDGVVPAELGANS